ncbi:acetoacetate--CoA ligase, partial [Streptomyces sp. SID10244]|nr:acetoacetate--CoA ligase [Streptomyces sp. SID10244]
MSDSQQSTSRTTYIDSFAEAAAERSGRDLHDYAALWQWSVDEPARFWRALWDFYDLDDIAVTADGQPLADDADVLVSREMPGAQWFPRVRLNYVSAILRHADRPGAAIVGIDE